MKDWPRAFGPAEPRRRRASGEPKARRDGVAAALLIDNRFDRGGMELVYQQARAGAAVGRGREIEVEWKLRDWAMEDGREEGWRFWFGSSHLELAEKGHAGWRHDEILAGEERDRRLRGRLPDHPALLRRTPSQRGGRRRRHVADRRLRRSNLRQVVCCGSLTVNLTNDGPAQASRDRAGPRLSSDDQPSSSSPI